MEKDIQDFVVLAQGLGCRGDEQSFRILLDAVLKADQASEDMAAVRRRSCGRLGQPQVIVEIGRPRIGRRVAGEDGHGREFRDDT
jgi:hypothetical protein